MQYLISNREENGLYKQPWKSVTRIKLFKMLCHWWDEGTQPQRTLIEPKDDTELIGIIN